MIGLDTNAVVRFLVQDDPQRARRAATFIEGRLSVENPGFISLVVLTEIAWVLRSCTGSIATRSAGRSVLYWKSGNSGSSAPTWLFARYGVMRIAAPISMTR